MMLGLEALTLHAVENPCVTQSWPSLWFFHIRGSTSVDSTNLRLCSTVVFTIEKNPCISRHVQFKPVLFKNHLDYIKFAILTILNIQFSTI